MIGEVNAQDMSHMLSDAAYDAYRMIKALILKIFSIIRQEKNHEELKEEFYHSYIRFANRLNEEGYEDECYDYMAICEMYYLLIDRPDELIAHEEFFNNLFDAFEELLFYRINNPDEYEEKYREYIANFRKARRYFYTQVAIPSPHYDEEVLHEIASNFFKVIE